MSIGIKTETVTIGGLNGIRAPLAPADSAHSIGAPHDRHADNERES